jgi:hypothetical protein
LSLKSRDAGTTADLIHVGLLLGLHRSDIQNRDGISLTQSRQHFRDIVVRDAEPHDLRGILAVLHDEHHSATPARSLTECTAATLTALESASLAGAALLRLRATL